MLLNGRNYFKFIYLYNKEVVPFMGLNITFAFLCWGNFMLLMKCLYWKDVLKAFRIRERYKYNIQGKLPFTPFKFQKCIEQGKSAYFHSEFNFGSRFP